MPVAHTQFEPPPSPLLFFFSTLSNFLSRVSQKCINWGTNYCSNTKAEDYQPTMRRARVPRHWMNWIMQHLNAHGGDMPRVYGFDRYFRSQDCAAEEGKYIPSGMPAPLYRHHSRTKLRSDNSLDNAHMTQTGTNTSMIMTFWLMSRALVDPFRYWQLDVTEATI